MNRHHNTRMVFDWRTGVLLIGCLLISVAAAGEPVATLAPEKPTWGQSLQVTYNTAADGAKLPLSQDACIVAWCVYADGWHQHETFPLKRDEYRFVGEIPLKEPLCRIQIHFQNKYGIFDDVAGALNTMIYRPDGEPVRHAYACQISDAEGGDAKALFDKEMSLYPDNYYGRLAWWKHIKYHDAEQYEPMLHEELRRIEQKISGKPLDYQLARVDAYLDLNQEEQAREIVLDMLRTAPEARFTFFAAYHYEYAAYAQNFQGEGPQQVKEAMIDALRHCPASPLARNMLHQYIYDEEFPPDVLQQIGEALLAENPHHAEAQYAIAVAARRAGRSDQAYEAVRKAINMTLKANLSFPAAYAASREEYALPAMYKLWAETALKLQRYDEAIAAAKTSGALQDDFGAGAAEDLEGVIWSRLCYTRRAEDAFLDAQLQDHTRGRYGFRKLYLQGHGTADGFEAHYSERLNEALQGSLQSAPEFSVTTLDGKSYDAKTLRGKVLALNFWFIGCGPCRAEIPELNKLVATYHDRDDLVFLAPAHDTRDNLRVFLEKHKFDYQIVPDAMALNELFEVHGHPTHIIIDRKGRIVWRGSGDRTMDDLKPMIDRALAIQP